MGTLRISNVRPVGTRDIPALFILFAAFMPAIRFGTGELYGLDFVCPLLALYLVGGRQSFRMTTTVYLLGAAYMLFALVIFWGALNYVPVGGQLVGLVRYFEYLFVIPILNICLPQDRRQLLLIVLLIGTAFVGITQFAGLNAYLDAAERFQYSYGQGYFRPPSVYLHPNIFAFVTFFIAISIISRAETTKTGRILVVACLVAVLITSNSRGTAVLVVAGFAVALLRYFPLVSVSLGVVLLPVLAIIFELFRPALSAFFRLSDGLNASSSLSLRIALWRDAWRLFLESPLLGHGYNAFTALTSVSIWGDFGQGAETFKTHANSFVLEHLADEGLPFTLIVLYLIFRFAWRVKGECRVVALTVLTGGLIYDDLLHDPVAVLIFSVALLSAAPTCAIRRRQSSPEFVS